tara:strand:+ start:929 stop:1201 length:273 start_codon:yes stop_codon:yes gene_type:complete
MSTKIEGIGKDVVLTNTPLKEWLVNYVGVRQGDDGEEVTVEMIVDTLSQEFPEFLVHVAEENWIRGYHQAMMDVDVSEQILKQIDSNNEQ